MDFNGNVILIISCEKDDGQWIHALIDGKVTWVPHWAVHRMPFVGDGDAHTKAPLFTRIAAAARW